MHMSKFCRDSGVGFPLWHMLGEICVLYLTIRLRARDFYAVIVDEGEAQINYHRIEIESE